MKDHKGNNCLWYAVSNQHLEAIDVLIFDVKVNVDIECQYGNTALHKLMLIDANLSRQGLEITDPKRIHAKKIAEKLLLQANIRKLNDDQ